MKNLFKLTVFSVSIIFFGSSHTAHAGLANDSLPIRYPTTINNPIAYEEIKLPGNQIIGNCLEGNGQGVFRNVTSTQYYGNVPYEEDFLVYNCTVHLIDLGKIPQYSVWWTPFFDKATDERYRQLLSAGIVLKAIYNVDVYGRQPTLPSKTFGYYLTFVGSCRKTLPPRSHWFRHELEKQMCDETEFRDEVPKFSKTITTVFLKQELDKSVVNRYPCKGFTSPGVCTNTSGGSYGGQCLEYGPPSHYQKNDLVNCEEIP